MYECRRSLMSWVSSRLAWLQLWSWYLVAGKSGVVVLLGRLAVVELALALVQALVLVLVLVLVQVLVQVLVPVQTVAQV